LSAGSRQRRESPVVTIKEPGGFKDYGNKQ